MTTNFIFGDSLSYGLRNKKSWVQLLREAKSDEIYYNLSINGETTSYLLKRIKFELSQRFNVYDNNRIFLFIGINDSRIVNYTQEVSLEEFEKNYIKLLDILQGYTDDIVVMGLTPVNEEIMKNYVEDYNNSRIKYFDNVIMDIVRKRKLRYVNLFDKLLDFENTLSSDGIHLSELGTYIIFEQLRKVLVK